MVLAIPFVQLAQLATFPHQQIFAIFAAQMLSQRVPDSSRDIECSLSLRFSYIHAVEFPTT